MAEEDYKPIEYFRDTDSDKSSRPIRDFPANRKRYDLAVFPKNISFNKIKVDEESIVSTIIIKNTGYDDIFINEIVVSGDFELTSPNPTLLKPNYTASIGVRFKPTKAGNHTGAVYINTGDASGDENVYLMGEAEPVKDESQQLLTNFILALNSGSGDANYIQATTKGIIPAGSGNVLIGFNITETNTSEDVFVEFNGLRELKIIASDGNSPAIGSLIEGMTVIGFRFGSEFRLLVDNQIAAILAYIERFSLEEYNELLQNALTDLREIEDNVDAIYTDIKNIQISINNLFEQVNTSAQEAKDARDEAVAAAESVQWPVSYGIDQSLTQEQRLRAVNNINGISTDPQILNEINLIQAQVNLNKVNFNTISDLLNDNILNYTSSADKVVILVNSIIRAGDKSYKVAPSDATDWDEQTVGGLKLLTDWVSAPYINRFAHDVVMVEPYPDDEFYNRQELQAAIDYIEAGVSPTDQIRRSGGKLLIGNGRCPIDQPIIPRRRGLVIEGRSRGTVIFPSSAFPENRALIQSRSIADRGGDANGPFSTCTVKDLTLCGVDPDVGDFAAPNTVIGAWFSRMDAQANPYGFQNVKFRALKDGVRGTRLYGMTVSDCTFEGGTSGSHWGLALNFDQGFQDGEADDPGGVRAFYCDRTQFMYLSQAIVSRYGYGYGFSAIRVEQCTPDPALSALQRAVFFARDARGWSIGGGSYFEALHGSSFIFGGSTPGNADDCQYINIKDIYIQNTDDIAFNLRGIHSSTFQDIYWGPAGTRVDYAFVTGADNYTGNIFEKGEGTVNNLAGLPTATNILETRTQRITREIGA